MRTHCQSLVGAVCLRFGLFSNFLCGVARQLTVFLLTGLLVAGASLSQPASAADLEYTWTTLAGALGGPGTVDGLASAARFHDPNGVAVGPDGNIIVTDFGSGTLRRIAQAFLPRARCGAVGAVALAVSHHPPPLSSQFAEQRHD